MRSIAYVNQHLFQDFWPFSNSSSFKKVLVYNYGEYTYKFRDASPTWCMPSENTFRGQGAAKNPGGSHDLAQPRLLRERDAPECSGTYDKSCLKLDAEQLFFQSNISGANFPSRRTRVFPVAAGGVAPPKIIRARVQLDRIPHLLRYCSSRSDHK